MVELLCKTTLEANWGLVSCYFSTWTGGAGIKPSTSQMTLYLVNISLYIQQNVLICTMYNLLHCIIFNELIINVISYQQSNTKYKIYCSSKNYEGVKNQKSEIQ